MTELSAPWDGVVTGDASLGPYSSAEWFQIWKDICLGSKADEGPVIGSGVSPDPGLTVQATTPASASVNVTPGSALVRGGWYRSDATVNLPIAANGSGNPRIDTITLYKDYLAQTTRLHVHQGAAAVSPVAPVLNQVDLSLWETPLADIAVANGFATIVGADIRPRRHWISRPDGVYLLDVLNNSGGLLETGDVVIWDTSTNRAVTTTTVLGSPNTAGVWQGRTPAGGYGRVLVKGIGYVNINGAVNRYQAIETSGTAKKAVFAANSTIQAIGLMLETLGGSGLGLAYIDIRPHRSPQVVVTSSVFTSTSTSTSFTITRAEHSITFTPRTSKVKITAQLMGGIQDGTKVGYYDIYSLGASSRAGDATLGLAAITGASAPHDYPLTLVGIFTGLTPGTSQYFEIQYKTNDAGSYVAALSPVTVYAEEM